MEATRPRRQYYLTEDGVENFDKDEDATDLIRVDWEGSLYAGETLTGATWAVEGGGPTLTNEALAGAISTALVSGSGGVLTNTATTNQGRTLVRRLRIVQVQR